VSEGDRAPGAPVQPVLFAGVRAGVDSATLVMLAGCSDEIHCLRRLDASSDRRDLRRFERYRFLVQGLKEAILAAGSPAAVAVEGAELLASRRFHVHLLEQGALLRYSLLAAGLAVTEVPPPTVRQFATGDSWARDPVVAARLAEEFGACLFGADETIAYALAQIARCLLRPEGYDPRRRAALSGVVPPLRALGRGIV